MKEPHGWTGTAWLACWKRSATCSANRVEAYGRALNNQEEALRVQREGMGRARKVLAGLGLIIVIVLVMVLVLLRYILRHYA